jgi:selenide, water dikinase
VPAIEGVPELLESSDGVSGGNRRNLEFAAAFTWFGDDVAEHARRLVCDPMTSGGLLVAVPAGRARAMEAALRQAAPATVAIGALGDGEPGAIRVV